MCNVRVCSFNFVLEALLMFHSPVRSGLKCVCVCVCGRQFSIGGNRFMVNCALPSSSGLFSACVNSRLCFINKMYALLFLS